MNLDHLTQSILELANRLIGTRTFFVSMIDYDKYTILKVINNDGSNIVEGTEIPLHQTL